MTWQDLPTRALSIRQPWAWAIVKGFKPVENRDWKPSNPALKFARSYRGPIFIHASKTMSREELMNFQDTAAVAIEGRYPPAAAGATLSDLEFGGIVGMATLADVVTSHPSKWFFGPVGLVLAGARPLPFTPMSGALGFFEVPEHVRRSIAASLQSPSGGEPDKPWRLDT